MNLILHITHREQWERGKSKGVYTIDTLFGSGLFGCNAGDTFGAARGLGKDGLSLPIQRWWGNLHWTAEDQALNPVVISDRTKVSGGCLNRVGLKGSL